jgi:ABC-type xylose transport system permease subunit
MFIILNTSFLAHTRFFTLILSITIWHVLALVWHLWNRELEDDVDIQLRAHVRSVISYAVISIIFLLLQPFLYPPYGIMINLVIMAAAIGSMIIFNATRLHYILANPK